MKFQNLQDKKNQNTFSENVQITSRTEVRTKTKIGEDIFRYVMCWIVYLLSYLSMLFTETKK